MQFADVLDSTQSGDGLLIGPEHPQRKRRPSDIWRLLNNREKHSTSSVVSDFSLPEQEIKAGFIRLTPPPYFPQQVNFYLGTKVAFGAFLLLKVLHDKGNPIPK